MFKNEIDKKTFELIVGIYLKSKRVIEQQLKTLNMTYAQFRAMFVLCQKDNITQREFADVIESDTTTVMVICDSLEKKGWLQRMNDPADRRVNRIVLTNSGRSVITQAITIIQPKYENALKNISIDELKASIPTLEKIYNNVRENLEKRVKVEKNNK